MKERRVLTPKVFSEHLFSSVSAHVNKGHQIWGPTGHPALLRRSSQQPGGQDAGVAWMALILPGLEAGGRTLAQGCLEAALALHSQVTAFLPALCLSHVTQVRLMTGLLSLVGHDPNLLVTVKLQCL